MPDPTGRSGIRPPAPGLALAKFKLLQQLTSGQSVELLLRSCEGEEVERQRLSRSGVSFSFVTRLCDLS